MQVVYEEKHVSTTVYEEEHVSTAQLLCSPWGSYQRTGIMHRYPCIPPQTALD